jgi:hypothetical protein
MLLPNCTTYNTRNLFNNLSYTYDQQYDKTLDIYLRLRRGSAFDLIEQKDLFYAVQDKVLLLMNYDIDRAVQLLVNNTNRVPVRKNFCSFINFIIDRNSSAATAKGTEDFTPISTSAVCKRPSRWEGLP